MNIWRGQVLWWGYIHPIPILIPIPNRKNRGFPIPILSQCEISRQNGDGFRQYLRGQIYLASLVPTNIFQRSIFCLSSLITTIITIN